MWIISIFGSKWQVNNIKKKQIKKLLSKEDNYTNK